MATKRRRRGRILPGNLCSLCGRRAGSKVSQVSLGYIVWLCLREQCRAMAEERVRAATWSLYYCGPRAIRILSKEAI